MRSLTAWLAITASLAALGGCSSSGSGEKTAPPAPALGIEPSSHGFGSVATGAGASFTFTVRNSGTTGAGALAVDLTGPDAAAFALTSDGCDGIPLAASSSCQIEVSFLPDTLGTAAASLTVNGSPGGSLLSALSGLGATPATLELAPGTQPFGGVVLGASSATQTFTVSNSGGVASGPLTVGFTGTGAGEFVLEPPTGTDCVSGATTLGAGASCTVQVHMQPTSRGAKTAWLGVTATPGSTASAMLSGTGLANAALWANPTSLTFPLTAVGESSAPKTTMISNTGDVASGVPSVTTPADWSASGCTAPIPAGGSCTLSVTFSPTAGGNRSGTISISASPGGSPTVAVSGPGGFRLTVSRTGTGAVTSPEGLNCGTTCTAVYANMATTTLAARTANGSDAYFQGWGGDCAGSFHDCALTMSSARTVIATFAPQTQNLVFVSSTAFANAGAIGSLAAADAECNRLASSAGINNVAGTNFVAWMSDSMTNALARLGATTRGFVRMDGRPFSDTQTDLVTNTRIWNLINLDETGAYVSLAYVATGTYWNGTTGATCGDWTNGTSGFGTYGLTRGGPGSWTHANNFACSLGNLRLYCFGKTKANAFSVLPSYQGVGAKLAFLTNTATTLTGGKAEADGLCTASRPAGSGATVIALLATDGGRADAYLNPTATYVTPAGQLIGTGADVANHDFRFAGIWQQGDSAFIHGTGERTWTGASSPTTAGTASTTCNNWTSNLSTSASYVGIPYLADDRWFGFGTQPCNTASRLVCVEQ